MATTTYLTSNFGSGTDDGVGQKSTHSVWIKRTDPVGDTRSTIIGGVNGSGYMKVRFGDNDRLQIYGNHSGSVNCNVETKAEFRDVSGWYHVVLQIDTSNATASERIKWYINGELQELNTATYPSAGDPNYLVISDDLEIGRNAAGDNEHFDGTMSHFNATYGTVYAPTAFGETDATTGEWKIKTSPSVTYGTYGFFILKDGNSVTDQSGKGNNFTVGGGTLTKTEDNPSNVFATLNPLDNKFSTDAVFSNGNNYVAAGGAGNGRFYSTLGMVSGKYYCEIKNVSGSGGTPLFAVAGTSNYALSSAGSPLSSQLYDYALYNGNVYNNDATVGGSWGTPSDGNIIGIAINLDNEQGGLNKLYFSINGVWQNGADPSNFTSATGVVGITKPENMAPGNPGYGVGAYFFACGDDNSYAERRFATNFGNGYFQTTAVSSAGTNASGNGIFEYDVPTGYTALSTKGLNL